MLWVSKAVFKSFVAVRAAVTSAASSVCGRTVRPGSARRSFERRVSSMGAIML